MRRIFNNCRNAYQLYRNRLSLSSMIKDSFRGLYKPSLCTILVVIAGLIYIISPVDVIPDFIPVLGWIDDGAILYLLVKQLRKETERYAAKQIRQQP